MPPLRTLLPLSPPWVPSKRLDTGLGAGALEVTPSWELALPNPKHLPAQAPPRGRVLGQAGRALPPRAPTVRARSLRTAFLLISCRRMSMSNFLQCWMYSWLPSACLLQGHRQRAQHEAPVHQDQAGG